MDINWIVLAIVIVAGFVSGRLALRALGCALLGGKMFGGDFL